MPWGSARELAHAATRPGPSGSVDLASGPWLTGAIGLVLAADLCSLVPLPPFDTCAMDGWAVCGPGPWLVSGRLLPGQAASALPDLAPGHACGVSTGSMVPAGAEGLLRSEDGVVAGGLLTPEPGRSPDLADVRRQGVEASAQEVLAPAGTRITPPLLGLAASAGHDRLMVIRPPLTEILVLGNELLVAGQPGNGRIRDGLGVQLPAWVAAGGGRAEVHRLGDDAAALAGALKGSVAEVVVTTGGSARGCGDHVRTALAELGARIVLDGVQVRPGSPMQLAQLPEGRLVVVLPGNPLAALAGVVTLLWPVLAGLSGAALPPTRAAVAAEPISGPRMGTGLVPVGSVPVRGAGEHGGHPGLELVRPTGHQGSAMLRGIALASALAVVPAGGLQPGEPVQICPFPWS